MLQAVDVGALAIDNYRGIAPDAVLDHLSSTAETLRGAKVLHLSATPYGGGVSELLRSLIPLYRNVGLHADWKIISGQAHFFDVTKKIHNALQGASSPPTDAERDVYLETSRQNAALLGTDGNGYDFVFVHDPQPIAVRSFVEGSRSAWIWRCHIDTSAPNPQTWEFLSGFLEPYDAAVFTMPQFVPDELSRDRIDVIAPAIDPLSPKNMSLDERTTGAVLNWIGIEPNRPLITQVSRFDPWKDPLGVIAAYRLVRKEMPNVQLALVGSMALDDPEAWAVYRQITQVTESEPDIHVFTNLTGIGNIEVNAFQHLSSVVVQKSIREGFGLVVSEAMWKGTPVVAGRAGGIPLQMAHDSGGLLVDSVEECASAILSLLRDPGTAAQLAAKGRERVRQHFLLPRLLDDELTLLDSLVHSGRHEASGSDAA